MVSDTLKVGDPVPDFALKDQDNQEVRIKDYVGNHPLVIYFYPKDDTPGCTAEACSFRDQFEEFTDLGAQVFGISADNPESHTKFRKKYRLPFTLLSDTRGKVQKLFGVKKSLFGLIGGRSTFVIDLSGKVIYIFESQLQPKKHITEALKILKRSN